MGKGKIVYNGSTSYTFERNFTKEYEDHKLAVNVINETPDGKITVVPRYTRQEYVLPFQIAPTTQKTTFETAFASGLLDFYPDAAVSVTKFRGLMQFEGRPQAVAPNAWNFTVLFRESKEDT